MFFNPRFKDVSTFDLTRLIRVLHSAGHNARDAEREYSWRNAIVPMSYCKPY